MRQLASYPRQNGVAAALRELERLERTLFTLDWIADPMDPLCPEFIEGAWEHLLAEY